MSRTQEFKFSFWSLTQVFDKLVWTLSLLSIITFGGFLCFALCFTLSSAKPKMPLTTTLSMSLWYAFSIFIGENVPLSKHFTAIRHIM